jgi:anti-anti-sigma regulatory factor
MRAENKPIRVCCPSPSVRETFELTRLNKKFPLFDDLAGALAAFAE